MARKKRAPHRENHERWLVSYADFITLLFAFFVVLFSASQVDQRRIGKLARAVQLAFQELGVFDATSKRIPLTDEGSMPSSHVQHIGSITSTTKVALFIPSPNKFQGIGYAPEKSLFELKDELQQILASELKDKVRISLDHRGLIISLAEAAFFDSGSAVARESSLHILDRIGKTLSTVPNHIRIEGHTDNVPINTPKFPSNWELSTARATFIISYLLSRFPYSPERLSAAGYAEFRPIASNDTPEGRALNRRVDIVVLSERTSLEEPLPKPYLKGSYR